MNRNRILLASTVFAVAIIFGTPLIVEPLLDKKITAALNEKYTDYIIEIDKVHWSLIPSKLKLKKITISSNTQHRDARDIRGEVESVQLKGIQLIKSVFTDKYEIDEIIISNSHLEGKVPFLDKEKLPIVSSINIHIGNILFDQINLALQDSSSARTLSVIDGVLNIADLKIEKLDTLGIPNHLNFKAEQVLSVSTDSLYTYIASGIIYSDTLMTLSIGNLSFVPNYKGYDFTAKQPYETDRIEAVFSPIYLYHFPAADYFNSGNFASSYIEIGNIDMNIFRDKRKEDSPLEKPVFQDVIYKYPGRLRIDSIGFNNGTITYTEHAEKANEPGKISMNEVKVRIYNITNDTIYKTKDGSMEMMAEALLMGKSKMKVALKAKLFDNQNTFSMNGTLAELEVKELNPILEKNAFIYFYSAKIEQMSFNFTANDTKATGEMTMLYNGLDIAIKNKRTDDTKTIKEQIISLIANKGAWDSNPLPGEDVRVGIIDYERDPTRAIMNYSIKSIISGIKSSTIKIPNRKRNFLQRLFSSGDENQKNAIKN